MTLVYVNGELVEQAAARISVFDHGLVVGDGVFETVFLSEGRPFAFERHLARLGRSAGGLGIATDVTDEVRGAVAEVVATCRFSTGRIRITVTSGAGPLASTRGAGAPTVIVAAEAIEATHQPANVAVVPWTRNEHGPLAGLKTISYAGNARALAHAHAAGAEEAIFANTAGMLCEGTGSNVFIVLDGELVTPPLSAGCLDGVTRALVLERHGGHERDVPMAAFRPGVIEEAFLTSTLRGVQPIGAIDGQPLALVPGPETEKAAASYQALLTGELEP